MFRFPFRGSYVTDLRQRDEPSAVLGPAREDRECIEIRIFNNFLDVSHGTNGGEGHAGNGVRNAGASIWWRVEEETSLRRIV